LAGWSGFVLGVCPGAGLTLLGAGVASLPFTGASVPVSPEAAPFGVGGIVAGDVVFGFVGVVVPVAAPFNGFMPGVVVVPEVLRVVRAVLLGLTPGAVVAPATGLLAVGPVAEG